MIDGLLEFGDAQRRLFLLPSGEAKSHIDLMMLLPGMNSRPNPKSIRSLS
jgi:hypothetical protein